MGGAQTKPVSPTAESPACERIVALDDGNSKVENSEKDPIMTMKVPTRTPSSTLDGSGTDPPVEKAEDLDCLDPDVAGVFWYLFPLEMSDIDPIPQRSPRKSSFQPHCNWSPRRSTSPMIPPRIHTQCAPSSSGLVFQPLAQFLPRYSTSSPRRSASAPFS